MQVLNSRSVVVNTSSELKNILEEDNNYKHIYLGSDITLDNGITINENKKNIIIDGTYLGVRYTLTGVNTLSEEDTITASANNERITIRDINIINSNTFGIINAKADSSNSNLIIEYNSIKFNGVVLGNNSFGTIRIIDSVITIEDTSGVPCEKASESRILELGGKMTISSSSVDYPLFVFRSNVITSVTFLSYCDITLTTTEREFMSGTYKLNFTLSHDAVVNLITANGFARSTIHGALNILIDERATLNFIENKHQRIPMWSIFGNLTVNEGANFYILNTYESTPSDNYNLHFKGTNQNLTFNNPNSVIIYTKNANVLYTNNTLNYSFRFKRLNMWDTATEFTIAGDINDLPPYSWYKESDIAFIKGIITSDMTVIESYNFTSSELSSLSDIGNFVFKNRKVFSIGNSRMNISPINNNVTSISGYTTSYADVLIKYNGVITIVTSDFDGLFTYNLTDKISDGTSIEFTTCSPSSFIYETRKITTPFNGELTIMDASKSIVFSLTPISYDPVILPRESSYNLKIVDSRLTSSNWKLYISITNQMISKNNFTLNNAFIFKKFDNDIVILNDTPTLIYTGTDNGGTSLLHNITWSTDNGMLLKLDNCALEINEEYSTNIIWNISE